MSRSGDEAGERPPEPAPVHDGELASRVQAFLAERPDASRAALVRFLRGECGLSGSDARDLTRAIRAQVAELETQIRQADSYLVSALALAHKRPPPSANWPLVLQRAAFHQVAPLLYVCLKRDGSLSGLPDDTAFALRAAFERVASHGQALYAELGFLLDALAAEGIEAIVLKGIALTPALYGEVGARSMVDLDIMVRAEDVRAAEGVLEHLGFGYSPVAPAIRPPEFLRRFGGSAEYCRQSTPNPALIDLHWRLTNSEWLRRTTRIQIAELWATSRRWEYGSLRARQLSPFYQVAHLVLHFLKHKFGQGTLRMLVDVDRLMRLHARDVDPEDWVDRANICRISSALYAVLGLSACLLGTPVPPSLLEELAPKGARRKALDKLILRQRGPFPVRELRGWSKLRLEFLLTSDPTLAASALWRLFFPERAWLLARYEIPNQATALWRVRLTHPLRVLRSGDL